MGCACIIKDKEIISKDLYLIDEETKVHQNEVVNINNITSKLTEDSYNVIHLEKSNKIKEKIKKNKKKERITLSGPIISLLKNRVKNHYKIKNEH